MDRFLYLAMTGAKHNLQAQQHTSHNLANANTPGFRADLDAYLSAPVYGPGLPSRVYSQETGIGADMSGGTMMNTGRDLDIAVQGDGWIAVQAPDGAEAYTRRGDLRINNAGLLETGSGELVMGNNGPVAIPPADKVEIGNDGTISIVPLGQDANVLAVLDRIKLVDPEPNQLEKGADGLFRLVGGDEAVADAGVTIASGVLEGSNVNTVDALVQMIDNARQFETYVKLMSTAKENDEVSTRLLRQS
ncbi:flagellar basal-body rod protein FlgF [Alkalilimnicola ehrlichii]|uniref:Flagellar basal-body rod protein FlgF n=1 Tax=Alkalilimnicola ehrlichii TaxID=351052 RepID=A0A3E0WRW7_9GAMM|nr:flagellar basal-body rod protein FlgF [Alkalilimnicola ehrlichii]RFA28560.1 flagellar basal-body rod protein FlgF [Alkalilimnicola ehrlichii]RFA35724.1 flagellar basal-body rod protein FlgF [Alkalilimnicola ehrlichii]